MGNENYEKWYCCWCKFGPYSTEDYARCIRCPHVRCDDCFKPNDIEPSICGSFGHQPPVTEFGTPPRHGDDSNGCEYPSPNVQRLNTKALPLQLRTFSAAESQPDGALRTHRSPACLKQSKTRQPRDNLKDRASAPTLPKPPTPPKSRPMSKYDPYLANVKESSQFQEKKPSYQARLKDPSSFAHQWRHSIIPALAKCLKDLHSETFSIDIVRDRSEKGKANAIARIQKEDKKTRTFIHDHLEDSFHFIFITSDVPISEPQQEQFKEAFQKNLPSVASVSLFKFRFFQGGIVRTAGHSLANPPCQNPKRPHYERESRMGSSIGQGPESVATLGPCLFINNVPVALSVKHFLMEDEVLRRTTPIRQPASGERCLKPGSDHDEACVQGLEADESRGYIGRVLCTSEAPQGRSATSIGEDTDQDLDWALMSLEGHRKSTFKNSFRRQDPVPSTDQSVTAEDNNASQDEIFVHQMAEINGGEEVELVGRSSGHQRGYISSHKSMVNVKGQPPVNCWKIEPLQLPPMPESVEEDSTQERWIGLVDQGDSGACIVTAEKHEAVGIVWGSTFRDNNVLLLACVSPMVSIVQEIKQKVQTKIDDTVTVGIHQEGEPVSEAAIQDFYARLGCIGPLDIYPDADINPESDIESESNNDSKSYINLGPNIYPEFDATSESEWEVGCGGSHLATAAPTPREKLDVDPDDDSSAIGGRDYDFFPESPLGKRGPSSIERDGSTIGSVDQKFMLEGPSFQRGPSILQAASEEGPSQKRQKFGSDGQQAVHSESSRLPLHISPQIPLEQPCENCSKWMNNSSMVRSDIRKVERLLQGEVVSGVPRMQLETACVQHQTKILNLQREEHPNRTLIIELERKLSELGNLSNATSAEVSVRFREREPSTGVG